jgi:hypothetical protein
MTDDQRAQRAVFADPTSWPHRPRLPLMRRGGGFGLRDCGYLVEGDWLTVHLGNILLPPTGELVQYATIEALLGEWRVD